MKLFSKNKQSKNGRQATAPRRDEKPLGAVRPSAVNEAKRRSSKSIFSGEVLLTAKVKKYYTFVLYCFLLMLLYMSYNFTCHRTQREEISCRIELQRVRSKALLISSERLDATRYNNITNEIKRRGIDIQAWSTPATKITTESKDGTQRK